MGIKTVARPNLDDESGSSQPTPIRELVPELSSPFLRIATYGKMMNDAAVDVSMRFYKTPVLGSEFFMEPYSDSPEDQEISEFIWANLAEGMSAPFINSLEDILTMYEDGYSILEKVYEQREWSPGRKNANTRQYVMLKKLGVRPASNVKEIVYDDNGGPEKIVYNAIRAGGKTEEVDLEIAKLLIFTFNRRGGDLTGKSLLRTAYPHWYYKTHLYKIDAIQKERFSLGVLKGKLMPGFSVGDKAVLRTLLRNYRTNEEQFMLLTPNVDVEVEWPPGTPADVLDSANHHNTMILMNVLGQFLSLGTTGEGGGRATAGTQSDLFMKSLRYIANQICQEINMYLIPELVVWNYPTTNFPKLQVRNIGETRDLQMFAAALANLYAQEVVTKGDPATEAWVRKVFDMPALASQPATPTETPTQISTNGQTAQKGNVRTGGQTGYVGKPPNAPE
jgi:hypothetical protein